MQPEENTFWNKESAQYFYKRIHTGDNMTDHELYQTLRERQNCRNNLLVTEISGACAGKKYFFSDGKLLAGDEKLPEEMQELFRQTAQSSILDIHGVRYFAECLKRPAHLVICGGGHVAQQVLLLAGKVGFSVTVVEDRLSFADEARKNGADQVICDSFASGLGRVTGNDDTYFLVMTRGHRYDKECLEEIFRKKSCYIGMMSSRGRAALLKKQMTEEGISPALLEEIATPVGLPIHAETPEEIAVSIVAELISRKNSLLKTSGYDEELMRYLTGEKEPESARVLATIIRRRGSAPRSTGTKMLVLEDGRIIGTIGGGCMENEVRLACLHMMREGQTAKCITVDMSPYQAEEEGLVCGGTIEVFLEVIK